MGDMDELEKSLVTGADESRSVVMFGKPVSELNEEELQALKRYSLVELDEVKKALKVVTTANDLDTELKRGAMINSSAKAMRIVNSLLNDALELKTADFSDDSHKDRGQALSSIEKRARFIKTAIEAQNKMADTIVKLGKVLPSHSIAVLVDANDNTVAIADEERRKRLERGYDFIDVEAEQI